MDSQQRPLPPLPASVAPAPDPSTVLDPTFLSPRADAAIPIAASLPLPAPPPKKVPPRPAALPLAALLLEAWGADSLAPDVALANERAVAQRVADLLALEDAAAVLGRARCAQASHFFLPDARFLAKYLPSLASILSFLLDAEVDAVDDAPVVRWKGIVAERRVHLRPAQIPGRWHFVVSTIITNN